MGPINYNIAVPDALDSLTKGFSLGQGIQQIQKQRAQQEQYKADLQAYTANPSAQGAAALALKYPQQREAVKQSWDTLQEAERNDQGKVTGQVYAALNAGRGDIANRVIQQRIDALTNSGKDASAERNIMELISRDPNAAKSAVGLLLAQINDPKTFATQFSALGKDAREAAKLPGELEKVEADIADTRATTQRTQADTGLKQVEQQFAVRGAEQKLRQGEANINNTQSQIDDRLANQRIQELNVQIGQANSETQRGQLILERDKLAAEQAKKAQDKAQAAQGQFDTVESTLATVDRILKHPGLEGWDAGIVGTGAGTVGGKQLSYIPGTNAYDFRALVNQLTSQQFLANVKQLSGMGALSNAEGERIAAAAGNISADQSQKQLKTTLGVIQSTLKRAQERMVGSGDLSTTDKSFVLKSPVYGNVTDGQINRLLQQNPGSTRAQVIQFLEQGGGGAGGVSGR